MIKSSKEIILQALKLAQCQNSKAFDWAFLTSILNSTYTKLYNDLMGYSNSFVKYFIFTEKESRLPDDCYKVEMVFKGKEDNPYIISQSSQNNFIPNTYYIENNTIRIVDKKDSLPITVKYSVLPKTLTAPDEPLQIKGDFVNSVINPDEDNYIVGMDDEGFFMKVSGENFYYNFENETTEAVDAIPTYFNSNFNNQPLTYNVEDQEVYWGARDVTDYFKAYDLQSDEELQIVKMVWDNTHIAILYSNGDLYHMNGDWEKQLVNPYIYKGRYFKVDDIFACCGDDETGKGFLVNFHGKLLYISFVPDTVMNYPNGVFFDIMEDMIAVQLQALCNIDNTALREKLENDELSFYSSLQRSQQGIRIKNDSNRWRASWW